MIEITTSLIFLVSNLYGIPIIPAGGQTADLSANPAAQKEITVNGPDTLEEHVKDYYKDEPLLAEIAKCESRFKHFNKNGDVIRGELNEKDVGVMQINEKYHQKRAEQLGFDIYTLEGNMAYARWLYEKEGSVPWLSSSKCWKKNIIAKADREITEN